MPHCIIEYSSDLDNNERIKETVQIVTRDLEDSGLFDKSSIKTRAIPYAVYLVGGEEKSFVHLTIKILNGRSYCQKKELSSRLLNTLIGQFDIENITVEVTEIDKNTYSKKTVAV
ncbi:5-carboxymethyl-2-hydroxymuconate Delta-isomerase [Reichenbachiella versicolor]|uniref:5-carboxymethyl-2-hydroxymuconate Delta-isomerase n=1 Tax=Reichenbachiella versicolor TaxID=1821036 RepID=UPI000D6E3398|nr:5-carboxymethyl-2-hydroxymuconate Delta-isomerase [Reichenbachiella versicolor]